MEKATILRWGRALVVSAIYMAGAARVADAETLRVMKTGLGEGTITAPAPAAINCGTSVTSCNADVTGSVELNVTVGTGSTFTGWGGDCASVTVVPPARPPCTVNMTALRSVRANFTPPAIPPITDFSPGGLRTYLNTNTTVDTVAEFVAALPQEFRENWILMPRSESLQTGTAKFPRILLVSADATRVFTIALDTHTSYPGAHPNAIEYMQWNPADNNFHFHEIVLAMIPAMDLISPGVFRFTQRMRTPDPVSEDDPKCFSCHSTQNVKHDGRAESPGTTGIPVGSVPWKNKPNWDTYDSWGGMLGFNRDRIFQGTVEAAAFRRTFNLWSWQANDAVRAVIEQLKLQPNGVPDADRIIRWDTPTLGGGVNDGHIEFDFDPPWPEAVTDEPRPTGTGPNVLYEFNRRVGPATTNNVLRSEVYVRLHHPCQPGDDEGRGVELFDRLTLGRPVSDPIPTDPSNPACPPRPATPLPGPNALRIADELIRHPVATGNVPIDVRPIALAIASGCITVSGGPDIAMAQTVVGVSPAAIAFFDARNGMSFNDVHDDTRRREQSLTRRKADIARTTFDRDADLYVFDPDPYGAPPIADTTARVDGLIRQFGDDTLGIAGGTGGGDRSLQRLRQEVFRRSAPPGHPDETVMGGYYIDRENDSTPGSTGNHTPDVALYRYFLEPLGVSVDKWSMGVRGRSRTYTFADIFGGYPGTFLAVLPGSLGFATSPTCTQINPLVTTQLARVIPVAPMPDTIPTYTDIQRIFNKSCIECHDASIHYPPFRTYAGGGGLDLSENEDAVLPQRRLWRSLEFARSIIGAPGCAAGTPTCTIGGGTDLTNSALYRRITDRGLLAHPYNPAEPYNVTNPDDTLDPDVADERCPGGLMPCEGPPLSKVDIETFARWIGGGRPNTEGDPHIRTVDGVHYDFQSAGEFILLRGEGLELQARQTPVTTAGPVGPNAHTGLTSCVSLNTAVAVRVGLNRITYQPEIIAGGVDGEESQAKRRLRLRVDGKDVVLGADGITLSSGGRIVRTTVAEGIEIHVPGGEGVVITPAFWDHYQVWYMNIEVRHARSTEGVMGTIVPGNWLPALSNGDLLGSKPTDLGLVHRDLHETFARSWRVDATTSLFDYEPGLTPQSFVVEAWPALGAQQCVAPPLPGGPLKRSAPAPIARPQAEQLCQGIVDPNRKENCVADVMAMGEPGFARTYLATEALERRVMPGSAMLVSPQDNDRVSGARPVDFAWKARPGAEVIDVVYRHCIWNTDEMYSFERCVKLSDGSGPSGGVLETLKHRFGILLWIVLLVLLVIVVLLIVRYRGRGALVAVLLVAVLLGLLLLLTQAGGRGPQTTHVANLVAGKEYSWKVVAETGDGVFVESETYRLEVGP